MTMTGPSELQVRSTGSIPGGGILYIPEELANDEAIEKMNQSVQSTPLVVHDDTPADHSFQITGPNGTVLVDTVEGKPMVTVEGRKLGVRFIDFPEKTPEPEVKREVDEWKLNLRSQPVPAFKYTGHNADAAIRWADRFRTSSVRKARVPGNSLMIVDDAKSSEVFPDEWLYVSPITGDIESVPVGAEFTKLFTGGERP